MRTKTNEKHFSIKLFISLILMFLTPFAYQLIRVRLIADIQAIDGFSIIGHLEWFDLFNETLNAFLIVPLYSIFNQAQKNTDVLQRKINSFFLLSLVIYFVVSVLIYFSCSNMTEVMVYENKEIVVSYLQLETIVFFWKAWLTLLLLYLSLLVNQNIFFNWCFGKWS